MAGSGFDTKQLISQLLGFAILAVVLWKLVVPVLAKMAGDRTRRIEESFAKLEGDLAEAARDLDDYRTRLANIQKEIDRRIHDVQEEGASTRATLVAEAKAAAEAERSRAKREVALERDKAILELRATVTEATLREVDRLIDAQADEALHGRLVDKYLSNVGKAIRPA